MYAIVCIVDFPNRSRTLGDLRADVDSLEQRGDALAAGIVALEADDDIIRQEAANTAADLMQLGGVVATNKEDVSSPKITHNLSKFKRTPLSFFCDCVPLDCICGCVCLDYIYGCVCLGCSCECVCLAYILSASALPISMAPFGLAIAMAASPLAVSAAVSSLVAGWTWLT